MLLRSGQQPQQLLPNLRQLKMSNCSLASVEALLQLGVLTSVTSLHLRYMSGSPHTSQELSSALCALLEQLPQLEEVSLPRMELPGSRLRSIVKQLTSLSRLRSAELDLPARAT